MPPIEQDRKNPSLGVHLHSDQPNIVFLTVTTEHREPWLANAEAHCFLREAWLAAKAWWVGDYLIMPDHVHLFCTPFDPDFTIEQWITYWKREFRRRHGRPEWKFQSHGWHHRLRQDEDYSVKWRYVQENPIRKGFVSEIKDWPYKGCIHEIHW